MAQARTITGQVIGTDGAGLPGVTVVVKGSSQGTATDGNGNYSLSVPAAGGTLVFSSIGYDAREVAIGTKTVVGTTLSNATTGLDEVVVVGYGTQSRRDLTGSVTTIKGTELANKPVQSFEQALQGRAAGVNVTTPNGVLNNPPLIRVRGVSSISLSSAPLYVIDGIPAFSGNSSAVGSVPNNPLSNVNPSDIESVEILKDASATAIYGSRAAGGVILVTTKKGRKGQSRVSYDAWVGWSKPVRLYDLLGAQDYMNIKNEAVRNLNANSAAIGRPATNVEGFRPTLDAAGNMVETNWYDYVYRTGFSSSNNINFSGGTEKTNYYASVGYTDQKGMIEQNTFKRLSTRLNIDHKVYKTFSVGARIGYSNSRNASPNTGSVADGAFGTAGIGRSPLVLPPNVAPFNPDGSYNTATTLNNGGLGPGNNLNPATNTPLLVGYYNPIVDLENNYFRSDGNEVQGSVYANWEILKGLNIRTSYGINNISFEDRSFATPIAGDGYVAPPGVGGTAVNYYRTNKRWNWQNTAQYDRSFAENHNVSLLLGNEQQHTDIVRWGASRTAVADVFFDTFEGNFTNIAVAGPFQGENYLASFFGRLNYDYAKKYLLTVNARRDGYSAFAEKFRNFYGASAGYVLSEEGFWKNASGLSKLNFLKLTASYGNVGNGLGVDDFVSLRLYNSGLYAANPTLFFSQPGNANLSWETSKKTDYGLSFGAFDDRLRGEFAYYRNLLDGLILNVPQSPSRGIPDNIIPANVGSMRNTGVELSLSFNAVKTTNFSWTVNGNLTTLENRVLALATPGQQIGTATSGLETVNYTKVGQSVGELLAVRSLGVNPENGRRMVQLRNADGTPGAIVQYNHLSSLTGNGWTTLDGQNSRAPSQLADGEYFGPTLPKWYGGFDNTFTFKGFDLGVFIQYSGGNYIYNGTKSGLHDQRFWNNAVDILDRWTPENTGGSWPRVVFGDNVSNGSGLVMSENIEKGDFVRLRNVALGYTINSGFLERYNVASARFYAQVQNAALITNYSGIDPEISTNSTGTGSNTGTGVDRNSVGQARTLTVGLNIGF